MSNLDKLPEVSFINNKTVDELAAELAQDYQTLYQQRTGKTITLRPDDPALIMLRALALQLFQAYELANRAGRMNLLKYATGEYLDSLAVLKGTTRRSAAKSTCRMKFQWSSGASGTYTFPAGTRVSTGNGDVYWETVEEKSFTAVSGYYVVLVVRCTESGAFSNGYNVGDVNVLVDPLPFISSVSNMVVTAGGADGESDEALAERLAVLPQAARVGTAAAYREYILEYWALNKSTSFPITDILIEMTNTQDGYYGRYVNIYILLEGGFRPTSAEKLALNNHLTNNNLSPMTDIINFPAVSSVSYTLSVKCELPEEDAEITDSIEAAITAAVNDYVRYEKEHIAKNIKPAEIIQIVMNAGAVNAEVLSPAQEVVIDYHRNAVASSVTVTFI